MGLGIKKQPWMVRGNAVRLSTGGGVIAGVVEANVCGVLHVLQLLVRPAGVLHAFPYNPTEVELDPVKWSNEAIVKGADYRVNYYEQASN